MLQNRDLYREKFTAVSEILKGVLAFNVPSAGFYLWPQTPINDVSFAKQLYAQQNLTVLPGSFIARKTEMGNPGENRIRLALVPELKDCIEAAKRIVRLTQSI